MGTRHMQHFSISLLHLKQVAMWPHGKIILFWEIVLNILFWEIGKKYMFWEIVLTLPLHYRVDNGNC